MKRKPRVGDKVILNDAGTRDLLFNPTVDQVRAAAEPHRITRVGEEMVPGEAWDISIDCEHLGHLFMGSCHVDLYADRGGPTHDGSPRCQSGSIASGGRNAYCTCDTCF